MKNNKKLKAFSLAEVLLSITIIGVVTVLTVPTMKKHTDESRYVASVQKAMANLNSATGQIELDHGEAAMWDFKNKSSTIVDWYKKTMNTVPFPNNKNVWDSFPFSFMTADGMAWEFTHGNYPCGGGAAIVDVNGPEPPNVRGIDIHGFRIGHRCGTKDETTGTAPKIGDFGIYAMGDNVNDTNNVWACTSYAIKHRKMPWLYKPPEKLEEICYPYYGK